MDTWDIILLGVIQGLTEFLPVSSSGHLILAPAILGFEDQGLALDAILHLGTLLSIIIFFRKELANLISALIPGRGDPAHRRLAWSIAAASFPAGILGLSLGGWIGTHLRSPVFVAGNLLFWSAIFFWVERRIKAHPHPRKDLHDLTFRQIMFIGCAQAMALFPGTSRSGVTLAAGLMTHLTHRAAARFSFLLGTPIITAAGMLKLAEFLTAPTETYSFNPEQLLLGFMVSFGVGYLAIRMLLAILGRVGLMPFIIYRVILAGILLALFL